LHGQLVGGPGGGGDQVGYPLGLRQVHLAIVESPHGELTGLGSLGAMIDQQLQDLLLDVMGPVTGDLHHMVAGVGVGGMKRYHQHLVDRLVVFNDPSKMCLSGCQIARLPCFACGYKDPVQKGKDIIPVHTDHRDGA